MINNMQDFEERIGQDLYEVKSELRLSLTPQTELDEFLAEYREELDEDFYDSLSEELQELVDKLDETIVERLTHANEHHYSQHDAYTYTPDTANPDAYYPDFQRDVWGIDENKVYVNSMRARKSREERNRTHGTEKRIILTDIGSFDLALTTKASAAWMRVTHVTRKGVPYINVGAVTINLNTGVVNCGVYNCKWCRQLQMVEAHKAELLEFDREFAEYQLLCILAHLGDHTSPNHPFPKFVESPKRNRDDYNNKMQSRTETLTNQFKAYRATK